ncbi:hypothetical protein INR49_026052 [Caranx melampygus]|nr:hypothetical protein INR49_026052 [Caranx melampygus]
MFTALQTNRESIKQEKCLCSELYTHYDLLWQRSRSLVRFRCARDLAPLTSKGPQERGKSREQTRRVSRAKACPGLKELKTETSAECEEGETCWNLLLRLSFDFHLMKGLFATSQSCT